jgi:hypothetical protein
MSYRDVVAGDRRLLILQGLAEADGYSLRESVLARLLEAQGENIGHVRLRAQLEWLRDALLIELDTGADPWLARITRRGLDVASGKTRVAGVARPLPEA